MAASAGPSQRAEPQSGPRGCRQGPGSPARRLLRAPIPPGFCGGRRAGLPPLASRLSPPPRARPLPPSSLRYALGSVSWHFLQPGPAAPPADPRAPGPAPRARRTVGARRAGTDRQAGREGPASDPGGARGGVRRGRGRKGPERPAAHWVWLGDRGSPAPQLPVPGDWGAAPRTPTVAGVAEPRPGSSRREPRGAVGTVPGAGGWGRGVGAARAAGLPTWCSSKERGPGGRWLGRRPRIAGRGPG